MASTKKNDEESVLGIDERRYDEEEGGGGGGGEEEFYDEDDDEDYDEEDEYDDEDLMLAKAGALYRGSQGGANSSSGRSGPKGAKNKKNTTAATTTTSKTSTAGTMKNTSAQDQSRRRSSFSDGSSSTSSQSATTQSQPYPVDYRHHEEDGDDASTSTSKSTPAESKTKKRLRPEEEVFHQIEWDPEIDKEKCIIGYLDRFEGIREVPFRSFLRVHEDAFDGVPLHRIRYFRFDDTKVWDRDARIDAIAAWKLRRQQQQHQQQQQPQPQPQPQQELPQHPQSQPPIVTTTMMVDDVVVNKQQRQRVALYVCGSFNPIHRNHFNLLYTARQHLQRTRPDLIVVAAYLSPSSDVSLHRKFHKLSSGSSSASSLISMDLASGHHRLEMCRLAIEDDRLERLVKSGDDSNEDFEVILHDYLVTHSSNTGEGRRNLTHELLPQRGCTKIISVLGADGIEKVQSIKRNTMMICVANRKVDFDLESILKKKRLLQAKNKPSPGILYELINYHLYITVH